VVLLNVILPVVLLNVILHVVLIQQNHM
jgi:hypothetical protein